MQFFQPLERLAVFLSIARRAMERNNAAARSTVEQSRKFAFRRRSFFRRRNRAVFSALPSRSNEKIRLRAVRFACR